MSKGLALVLHCDACDKRLCDYSGKQLPGEVYCSSSILGAESIVLCSQCSRCEERRINQAGNDLPDLLKEYKMLKH